VHVWWDQDICYVIFALLLMLSLYKRLAPSPPLENVTGQKLTNVLYEVSFAILENLRRVLTKFSVSFLDCVTLKTLLRDFCDYLPVDTT
jgi:hypothetical protein